MGLKWEEMSEKEIIAADGTVISTAYEGYPDPNVQDHDEKWSGDEYVEESKVKEL